MIKTLSRIKCEFKQKVQLGSYYNIGEDNDKAIFNSNEFGFAASGKCICQ